MQCKREKLIQYHKNLVAIVVIKSLHVAEIFAHVKILTNLRLDWSSSVSKLGRDYAKRSYENLFLKVVNCLRYKNNLRQPPLLALN